jgi:cleavage and polyadenylation specificity factor subunit 1
MRTVPLRLGSRNFTWEFIIADVSTPLLGNDFLSANHLLVDPEHQRLVDNGIYSFLSLEEGGESMFIYAVSSASTSSRYDRLLDLFPEVFRAELRHTPGKLPKHDIVYRIETKDAPIFAKFRRLSPEKLISAKKAFEEMLQMGVIERATSPWASPLHTVPKPETWRPCGDYRRVNNVTVPDHYPLPNLQDFTAMLSGKSVFSKIDLLKGYFQIPVDPE